MDTTGELVIPAVYDGVLPFWETGIAKVWVGHDAHFIDRTGKRINYVFWPNEDGSAVVPASTFDYLPKNCPRLSPSPAELMAPAE